MHELIEKYLILNDKIRFSETSTTKIRRLKLLKKEIFRMMGDFTSLKIHNMQVERVLVRVEKHVAEEIVYSYLLYVDPEYEKSKRIKKPKKEPKGVATFKVVMHGCKTQHISHVRSEFLRLYPCENKESSARAWLKFKNKISKYAIVKDDLITLREKYE